MNELMNERTTGLIVNCNIETINGSVISLPGSCSAHLFCVFLP